MGYPNGERCVRCSMPIPAMPEDAAYEELLCDRCYHELYCSYCGAKLPQLPENGEESPCNIWYCVECQNKTISTGE